MDMNRSSKRIGLAVSALLLTLAGHVHASAQLALAHGCYSCHGANQRGEAPSLERLSGKLAKFKGDDQAQAKFVAKYRSGEPLERVDAHERLSLESATALVQWLADGAK
jgi:cytochrome c551/c552